MTDVTEGCFHCRGEAMPLTLDELLAPDGAATLFRLMCSACQREVKDKFGYEP